jgi:hypothetical protein
MTILANAERFGKAVRADELTSAVNVEQRRSCGRVGEAVGLDREQAVKSKQIHGSRDCLTMRRFCATLGGDGVGYGTCVLTLGERDHAGKHCQHEETRGCDKQTSEPSRVTSLPLAARIPCHSAGLDEAVFISVELFYVVGEGFEDRFQA